MELCLELTPSAVDRLLPFPGPVLPRPLLDSMRNRDRLTGPGDEHENPARPHSFTPEQLGDRVEPVKIEDQPAIDSGFGERGLDFGQCFLIEHELSG